MIIDSHVHLVASEQQHSENYLSPQLKRRFGFRHLARNIHSRYDSGSGGFVDSLPAQTIKWLNESRLDKAVLLAFDAAYDDNGNRDRRKTLYVSANEYVAGLVSKEPKALFGASIHPYRRDAISELERVIEQGACLIKWLPGAQNIQPDDPRCIPFYEALAHYRLPLLCHTGSEHLLKQFPNDFNNPTRLIPALERGVTVIAAHCGTRLFLHEKSYHHEWQKLAERWERFYGDLSAFAVCTRVGPLRKMLRNPVLSGKLLFGSDFPALPMPVSFLGPMRLREALRLRRIKNPFDLGIETMKAIGVPAEVFSRAQDLLRLPKEQIQSRARFNGQPEDHIV